MDIRGQVKHLLRMCGHAFVSTVHDRLNGIEPQVNSLVEQNNSIAQTQTALLQSSIYAVETIKELRKQVDKVFQQIAMVDRAQTALLQSCLGRVGELEQQLGDLSQQVAGTGSSQVALVQSCLGRIGELEQRLDSLSKQVAGAGLSQVALLQSCLGRIGELEQQLGGVSQQVADAGCSQVKVLQSCLQIMESLKEEQDLARGQREGLRRWLDGALKENVRVVDSTNEALQQILQLQGHTQTVLEHEIVRQVCIETSDYGFKNPETGLFAYLYSYLPTRRAIDIGAHVGDVSEYLLRAGYEVYAFEPFPPVYEKLIGRLGHRINFHAYNVAVGSAEGDMPLYLATDLSGTGRYQDATAFNSLTPHSMPDDLSFRDTTVVPVKRLAGLHRANILPGDVALLKTDTEGFDLEVIRGMEDFRYPVVAAEFWDTEIPFGRSGLLYTLETLVAEMKGLGYPWHIVLYRLWGQDHLAYYCNHDRAVPESWGNVIFFRDYDLFGHAQNWCSAVLPRTYFKPAPAAVTARQSHE